eukprot:g14324.t1
MGGRWATSVVASVLATSASGFVSCPSSHSSDSSSCGGRTVTQHDYSSSCSSSSRSCSSRSFGCGSAAPGWASPSFSAVHQPRSRLFPGAAATISAGNKCISSSSQRRRGLDVMSVKLDTVGGRDHAYEVVFVRHGQSTWNKANRFIGWTDTELTEEGEIEARVAGQLLLSQGFEFDAVYTSMLKRAIKTAWLVLDELNQQHVPVTTDWHLNERCYGALVGREKKECVRVFGAEQVKTWRRSWDVPPPPIDKSSKLWPGNNPKYKFLSKDGESMVPLHESLKDVMARSSVYWDEVIAPAIRSGKRVCVCGHENNLRSLLKYVDSISNSDIMHVELPRAVPLVFYLDENLRPVRLARAAPHLSGVYVGDPEEIAAIQERDLKNVYDLTVSENLEEEAPRFAAKLDELVPECDVDEFGQPAGGAEEEFTGSFLETGVGDGSCRTSDIASKALLLYNREAGKKKKKSTDDNNNAGKDSEAIKKKSIRNEEIKTIDPVGAGAAAVASTLVVPSPTEQKSPSM